jgi:hypothetical protein
MQVVIMVFKDSPFFLMLLFVYFKRNGVWPLRFACFRVHRNAVFFARARKNCEVLMLRQ